MLVNEIQELPTDFRNKEEEDYKIIQLKEVKDRKLVKGKPTGFNFLDGKFQGGLREGDLAIISGLSGNGKSLLTLQIIKNYSAQRIPVLLFSFEEPIERIKWRLSEMGAKDDILCFTPKKLKSGEVEWLEQKILDGLAHFGIKIIAIDNLDFLTAERKLSQDDKWSIQSRIIAMLKRIAIEHKITIILNAHVKKLDNSQPKMEDLYGSGDIYKLADFVIFIHRLREEGVGGEKILSDNSKLIVEKNRLNGMGGSQTIFFYDNNFHETPREGGWKKDA
jgi:replicative DNA helicase|tara:strand:- start:2493 stop:3323 length:831 start_codon:yes stop_codon:yes gene_type:complete